MATWLKQSTAIEIKVGPFLDSTDGNTQETALTISQADVRLAKNGGDWAQKNESTTLVHEEAGWYRCLLDTTDTNTLGILIVAIHETGALPVWKEYLVVPANVYDSVVSGSDKLDVNVEEWNATSVPAEHTAGYPIVTVKDGTGTGELDTGSGVVLARDHTGTAIVDAVWAKAMTELGSVPGVTGTVLAALEWLFLLAHNKVAQTPNTQTLRNNADDGSIATATVSDDGSTFTRDKWS